MTISGKLLQALRKKIVKDYGKKCRGFEIGCVVCQAHLALDILESLYDEYEEKGTRKTRNHTREDE